MEKNKNLDVWNALSCTDPKFTKDFKRPGGFTGTSINPTWQIKRLTEVYGSVGFGWYYEVYDTQVHHSTEGHSLVFRDVALYVKNGDEWSKPIHGTGGESVIGKNKYGLVADDEAFKKSETDALGNAMKKLGMSSDVHMGMFDDNKYVNDMKAKFGDGEKPKEEKQEPVKKEKTPDELKFLEIKKAILSINDSQELMDYFRDKAGEISKLPEAGAKALEKENIMRMDELKGKNGQG